MKKSKHHSRKIGTYYIISSAGRKMYIAGNLRFFSYNDMADYILESTPIPEKLLQDIFA